MVRVLPEMEPGPASTLYTTPSPELAEAERVNVPGEEAGMAVNELIV
jgi:hypothetical protein